MYVYNIVVLKCGMYIVYFTLYIYYRNVWWQENGCGECFMNCYRKFLLYIDHDWYKKFPTHELVQGICTTKQHCRYMKFMHFRNTGCHRECPTFDILSMSSVMVDNRNSTKNSQLMNWYRVFALPSSSVGT